MSALQRHTLCWLESAELRLIARQLNGAFSAPTRLIAGRVAGLSAFRISPRHRAQGHP